MRPLGWLTLPWTRDDGRPGGDTQAIQWAAWCHCRAFLPEASCANGMENTLTVLGLFVSGLFSFPSFLTFRLTFYTQRSTLFHSGPLDVSYRRPFGDCQNFDFLL